MHNTHLYLFKASPESTIPTWSATSSFTCSCIKSDTCLSADGWCHVALPSLSIGGEISSAKHVSLHPYISSLPLFFTLSAASLSSNVTAPHLRAADITTYPSQRCECRYQHHERECFGLRVSSTYAVYCWLTNSQWCLSWTNMQAVHPDICPREEIMMQYTWVFALIENVPHLASCGWTTTLFTSPNCLKYWPKAYSGIDS